MARAIVIGLAIFAPYLSFLKNPDVNFIIPGERPPYPPSSEFWFGTDQDARDMFSRTVYGARTSLTVGFAAIAFGLLVGGSLGLLAGYFRGKVDQVISFCFLTLLSFPALVLAILITSLLERSLLTISMTIGVLSRRSGRTCGTCDDDLVRGSRVRARGQIARRPTSAHHRA